MTERIAGLPAAARRRRMLMMIERRGFVKVAQLSAFFGVTEVTVRSDLDSLARTGSVQRVHGGAVLGPTVAEVQNRFEIAEQDAPDEKLRIGRAAAAMVLSHQVIIIDLGTTTTAFARALMQRDELEDVTVVTSALNIALEFEPTIPRHTVIVTGGTLRPAQHSLVDPLGDVLLGRIHADIAFIGCNGIQAAAGATNWSLPETQMKRRMLASAGQAVLLADSSKIGISRSHQIVPLSSLDLLVTGQEAEGSEPLEDLRNAGLQILTAPIEDA
jgi:DeoR family transcriptional regulator of aga operon